MSLDIKNLDNKNFELLLQESISKLPSYSQAWTDYNTSDPGITLIELFAWLNDIDFYRLNRVNTQHYEAFLALAGIKKEDNTAAQVLLHFTSSYDIANYHEDEELKDLNPRYIVSMAKGSLASSEGLSFITQEAIEIYPRDFKILSLHAKEYGKEEKIREDNFYPFAKGLECGSYFTIELSHIVSESFSFYLQTHIYSDEVISKNTLNETLQWYHYDHSIKDWIAIENVDDSSNAFTKSGTITLPLSAPTHRLKCELISRDFYETPPLVKNLHLNTSLMKQEDRYEEFLAESNAYANQCFTLKATTNKGSIKVKVGRDEWQEVSTLKKQDASAKVFQIHNRTLCFGDGQYGKIPKKDLDIHCTYLSNAGSKGNLIKNSTWEVDNIKPYKGTLTADNFESAWGGKDSPSLQESLNNFQDSLKTIHRAVSLEDYEYLALHTPYTNLSKVKAYADPLKNHVTLILVPKSQDDKPQVSELTHTKVLNYLDNKKLLTTSLEIKKAKYQKVNLALTVFSSKQKPDILEKRIFEVLNTYLHPIYGGKETKGWSFSQNLYLSELYEVIASIEGVENIIELKINDSTNPVLEVDEMTLITKGEHTIIINGIDPVICRNIS